MPERDPRTDPRPGDVLKNRNSKPMTRTVVKTELGGVVYVPGRLHYLNLFTAHWQKWAADAEIVRRGDA